jgi:hypothetical protein
MCLQKLNQITDISTKATEYSHSLPMISVSPKHAGEESENDLISGQSSKRFKSTSTTNVPQDIQRVSVGILSMPHELLLEIPKYLGPAIGLPAERVHWMSRRWGGRLPYPVYRIRVQALRSLSQSSHSLRLFFLPLLWEHFDACCAKDDEHGLGTSDRQFTSFHLMLKLKSEGLIRHTDLAAFVRYVCITAYPSNQLNQCSHLV